MSTVVAGTPPAADAQKPKVFRGGCCGIASAERTCFIIPEKHTKGPRDTRCVMCEIERNKLTLVTGVAATLGAAGVPSFFIRC